MRTSDPKTQETYAINGTSNRIVHLPNTTVPISVWVPNSKSSFTCHFAFHWCSISVRPDHHQVYTTCNEKRPIYIPAYTKLFVCFWYNSPHWARASSFTRFLDHTQRRTTVGRIPPEEWSARRRELYLTIHNTHMGQTSMPPVRFEPTTPAGERPQTYALDRAATGTGSTDEIHSIKRDTPWHISTSVVQLLFTFGAQPWRGYTEGLQFVLHADNRLANALTVTTCVL
jgi:hypothetical protein